MATGMSVPGASDIGLGGTASPETDEERRKRLLAMQQSRLLPNSDVASSQLMAGFGAAIAGGR